jgi:hypothetical protein
LYETKKDKELAKGSPVIKPKPSAKTSKTKNEEDVVRRPDSVVREISNTL